MAASCGRLHCGVYVQCSARVRWTFGDVSPPGLRGCSLCHTASVHRSPASEGFRAPSVQPRDTVAIVEIQGL
eukprot:3093141-Prymnesium_polylepis.1